MLQFFGICETGLKREKNEDALLARVHKEDGLFVISDGMGGHAHGEMASGLIVERLAVWWDEYARNDCKETFRETVHSILQCLERINQEIYTFYNSDGVICGATIILLFQQDTKYAVISAGDSHIYQLQGRKAVTLTGDDIWENQLEIMNKYSDKEIMSHKNRGKLTAAMGISPHLNVKVITNHLQKSGSFLLCSDGLYKMCSIKAIRKTMLKAKRNDKLQNTVTDLKKEVYRNGAVDNVSILLVSVK